MKRVLVVLGLAVVFGGVQAQTWSQEAVDALVREGLVYGYPDGSVRPEAYVKRGEVFTLLWRLILTYRLKDLQDLTKEDIQALKGLLVRVEELTRTLTDQGQVLTSYADTFKEIRQRLASLTDEAKNLAASADTRAREAQEQVGSLLDRVSNLEATVYKGLRDFREEVNVLAEALGDLDAKVKALEAALRESQEGTRGELAQRFQEFQNALAGVSSRVSAAEVALARVGDVEAKLKDLDNRVASLEAQVKALREEVARLRSEMPRVENPVAFGVGVYVTGVSPLAGVVSLGYALPSGFGVEVKVAQDGPGFYGSLSVVNVTAREGFTVKTGLGFGRAFYGPGFSYGELTLGIGYSLLGDLGLGGVGVVSFPVGTGPSVARFGLGVRYGW